MKINTKKMIPIKKVRRANEKDNMSLFSLKNEAISFLKHQKWCKSISNGFLGFGIAGILAIFYFQIEPSFDDVDSEVWVIVGDIPPAYISIEDNNNPYMALTGYIFEMRLWINAVKNKKAIDDLIPVNVPPEIKYAEMLEKRLDFIEKNILVNFKEKLLLQESEVKS
jgi:hypothetical protein